MAEEAETLVLEHDRLAAKKALGTAQLLVGIVCLGFVVHFFGSPPPRGGGWLWLVAGTVATGYAVVRIQEADRLISTWRERQDDDDARRAP